MIRNIYTEVLDPEKAQTLQTTQIFQKTTEPIEQRTRSKKIEQNIYKTLPFKGTFHTIAHSYGKLGFRTRNWKTAQLWATE